MFSAALLVGLAALPFTLAAPSPTPTRPFVVRAYESPSPVGKGLSGYYLSAQKGSFYLTQAAPSPKPVLDVDHSGQAFLVSFTGFHFISLSLPPCTTAQFSTSSHPRTKLTSHRPARAKSTSTPSTGILATQRLPPHLPAPSFPTLCTLAKARPSHPQPLCSTGSARTTASGSRAR